MIIAGGRDYHTAGAPTSALVPRLRGVRPARTLESSMLRALLPAVFVAVSAGCAHRQPPPPPVAKSPAAKGATADDGELGPLVRVGFDKDVLGPVDGPLEKDGKPDYAFRVRIGGKATAIALYNSDTKGKLAAHEIWDTVCGATPFPPALDMPFHTGAETAALAVVDAQGQLLNAGCTMPPHEFAKEGEIVTLYVADPWNILREGRVFSLAVLRPDGRVDRSTVILV
jgi:hypothetical protein